VRKPSLLWPAIVLFGIYAVYGALLVPLNQYIGTDGVLQDSLLYDFTDAALHWIEILGLALCFGFLIDGVHRFCVGACRALFCLISGALFFKYISAYAFLMIWRIVPAVDLGELASMGLGWLVEASECAVVLLLAALRIPRAAALQKARQKAAKKLGEPDETPSLLLPFKCPFDRNNALQTTTLLAMVLLAAIRLVLFIIDDLAAIMIGLTYTFADVPVTLLYWLLLILLPAAGGYFLILLILTKRAKTK